MAERGESHQMNPGTDSVAGPLSDLHVRPLSEFGGRGDTGTATAQNNGVSRSGAASISIGMFWQAKWWMLGVFAVVAAVALPAIWLCVKPTYQARALVRVSPKALRIAFKNEENSSVSFYKTFVNTQVSILRGSTVLQRVLDQEKIRQTRWYNEPSRALFGPGPSHLERLTEALSTKMFRESELIEVAADAENPADARTLVNAVVDEYKKFTDETVREVDTQRYETVVEEHARLQKEIDGLIKTKFSIAKQLGTASPEELRSQLTTHLSRLEEEFGRTERALRMVQAEQAWLAASETQPAHQDSGEPPSADEANRLHYARDAEWRQLHSNLQEARHGLEVALQQYGESHPRIKELNANIGHAERLLDERQTQLDDQGRMGIVDGRDHELEPGGISDPLTLSRQADRLQKQLDLLQAEIDRQKGKVAGASDLAGDLAQYDEQIRRKRELGETLHARMTELELEGKAPARISVEAHATEPSRPEKDRRILFSVMALTCGLVLGMGVGYVRTVLDPRIREVADVRQSARVPFLGQLPPMPTTRRIAEGCTPHLLEGIRIVRTALIERFEPGKKGVVLITSTTSETGKTSLAALLSGSLAALGKKTLLVEADLRRPSLSERLGIMGNSGLAALLNEAADDRKVVTPTGVPRWDVVLAGDVPEDFDPELLASGVFEAAMTRWRKSYDFVLVDSPPVLPVADARILARQTDGTVMVLRSSHTRRTDVTQAYADLSAAGGSLLGTVLVGVRPGGGYGYAKGYGGYERRPRVLEAVS